MFYVVSWDLEVEDSGEVVRDGSVFTRKDAARQHHLQMFAKVINHELASRASPIHSRRLGVTGYMVDIGPIRAVEAPDPALALADALAGKGTVVEDDD